MALGPFNQKTYTIVHEAADGPIKVGRGLYDYRGSLWFDASKVAPDANGNKYIKRGMIIAKAVVATDSTYGDTYAMVPYEPGGTYGTGSNVPYGILDIRLNATLGAEAVSALYHGQVYERNCYVYGLPKGQISNAIKSALPDIDWV